MSFLFALTDNGAMNRWIFSLFFLPRHRSLRLMLSHGLSNGISLSGTQPASEEFFTFAFTCSLDDFNDGDKRGQSARARVLRR